MKKVLLVIIAILAITSFTACTNKDAISFKDEYESINNKENSNKQKHRKINIDKENPFVYITEKEIIEKIDNKETFYIYFGSSYCPWCRSVIEEFIKSAKKNNIKKVYYFDIWDGDHNEIFRDTYVLNDDNEPELKSKGTKEYKKLIKAFDNVLSDYTLTDNDGNKISVGEKRIFAPNFIYIEKGKAKKLVSGISSKQTDSRGKLTEEIKKEQAKTFNKFFK